MREPPPHLRADREALAGFQRELLLRLRCSSPNDPWWREQLIDPVSPQLLGYLQSAMTSTFMERLGTYFPRFVRHADLDAAQVEQLHAQIRVAVACGSPQHALERFFAGVLELIASFAAPDAWADLLRLERAEYLWRVERSLTPPELVAALRAAAPPRFDARGVDDREGFGFIRLDTTMIDLWSGPAHGPSEAVRWGPPRTALSYWSHLYKTVRVVPFQTTRELAIRLAFES
ncbi:hypothetical protein DB30_07345 [Enhygromyxa salina]|uniref:Uncharacterized protein n=1 Tax=Enhygromyxa salina TaxID=215803 RepID=A0A0C1ZSF6_9BACT|nr:hypothetical protein [Enhygromyxa salina]KIG14008.1 hypothetical protein DB30_07345 [Enhygromyxa salina]